MFEKEIEFIYNYNLNKIKNLGQFITFEQLKRTNLHPALLQYVSAEIDYLIYEDRQKLLKDSLFDYSDEKITEYFILIGNEIKKTKKFSIEYLTKLLLHASSFNVNFLIRPKWSLLQFVFDSENESTKPISEVKPILNYLYYYPYLKRLLISFFNKKRLLAISQREFHELLEKIDQINYENNFEKVLDGAFKSMTEFINMGEPNNDKLSKQMVELFLDDKGLPEYKMAVTESFGVGIADRFSISDYKKSILNFNIEGIAETDKEHRDSIINEQVLKDSDNTDVYEDVEEEQLPEEVENTEEDENDVPAEIFEEESDFENLAEEKSKSFIESHLENLDEEIEENGNTNDEDVKTVSEIDEIEPPEIDETPRIDEEIIEEAAELALEEEEIDETVENDATEFSRVEIDDSEPDPFENVKESIEDGNVEEDKKIEIGTSITFSAEETEEEMEEDWPSESSNHDAAEQDETFQEFENNVYKPTESSIILESDDVDNSIDEMNDDKIISEEEEINESLFSDEDFEESDNIDIDENSLSENKIENNIESDNPKIDISSLLENKKITKIIEVVFDYDMEDFANTIDEISLSNTLDEAKLKIDELAERNYISKNTKEIKLFKNIISEYFK